MERHARELGIWQARTWGPRIEDRGSQITFSALGQQAPVEAKEEWDPTNEKKNRLAEAVQKDVPHLAVRSGGSTSVDISNRGVDKAYAVRKLADMLGVTVGPVSYTHLDVYKRQDLHGAVPRMLVNRTADVHDTLAVVGM